MALYINGERQDAVALNLPHTWTQRQTFNDLRPLGKWVFPDVGAGWTTAVAGSGASTTSDMSRRVSTGATASSTARATLLLPGLNASGEAQQVDFAKKMRILLHVARNIAETETTARFWISDSVPTGAMAAIGLGIQIANFALSGISYGASVATVDLSTTMVTSRGYLVEIVHDPTVPKIEWYVDGVLAGTQSTSAKVPQAQSGNISLGIGIANGISGGTSAIFDGYCAYIWQDFP